MIASAKRQNMINSIKAFKFNCLKLCLMRNVANSTISVVDVYLMSFKMCV